MKVAFVTQPWDELAPPAEAGSSIAILTYQVARRLTGVGEITIYTKRGHSQQKTQHDDQGIQYRRISVDVENWLLKPFKLLDRLAIFRKPKQPFFASSLYYLGYVLQVAYDLRKQQPDIIHIHNFFQFIPVIRIFNPKAKIVLHMHCEWLTQLDPAMIERRLSKTDLVLSCSNYITEKNRHRFPQFASHCQTLFNGVDINRFVGKNTYSATQQNGTKRLLFAGRVSPEKGVHVLLDAFQEVVKDYPNAKLEIAGPIGLIPFEFVIPLSDDAKVSDLASFYGRKTELRRADYFSYLQAQLSSDIASRVSFLGFIPHSKLIEHYLNADIFIFPSVWNEPFGMPLVEAMASEVPTVATRGGGITEIVDEGQTGILVERNNAAALAEAILSLLADESLRRSMGQAGRQRVLEYFSWDRVADNLLNHYTNIC